MGKGKPLDVELDLEWGMLRSSLENEMESHLAALAKFKQKEDVRLYAQLPDYDDIQCYD